MTEESTMISLKITRTMRNWLHEKAGMTHQSLSEYIRDLVQKEMDKK